MSQNIAINGFGRIGRTALRIMLENPELRVVAINDLAPNASLFQLLKFDSTMGKFPYPITLEGDQLIIEGKYAIDLLSIRNPTELPWAKHSIHTVLECTGIFRSREDANKHLKAGAKKVLLSAPSKDNWDIMVVKGVNDSLLKASDTLVSNASCTTNCLAPIAKILDENFEIEAGNMTTVHAYTNDQSLLDVYHSDPRRARAAAVNIIPTSTGAASALDQVLPRLKGKINGSAIRVPVQNGSLVDLVVSVKKSLDEARLLEKFEEAAQGALKGIVSCSKEPLVSSDIVGNPHSAIVDSDLCSVLKGNMLRVVAWYDNEWGYSNRLVEVLSLMK